MIDWTSTMQQTYEFYIVDPISWKDTKLIRNVKSCTINRDSTAETLGSASLSMTEIIGECYVRIYLITIQNGVKEKHPLGTYLVQTPFPGAPHIPLCPLGSFAAYRHKKSRPAKLPALISVSHYSSEIAPTGHSPAQAPQEMQVSALISYLPSPSLIAPMGQAPAQVPQEMQPSEIL